MSDYYYENEDDEECSEFRGATYNLHEGWADNLVQARDIQGGINFYSGEPEYTQEITPAYEPTYFTALPWGFSVAAYASLFIISAAYAYIINSFDLSASDWLKLSITTLIIIPIFVATEYRLHGIEFAPLRFLLVILLVSLGVNQGHNIQLVVSLSHLVGDWLVWNF